MLFFCVLFQPPRSLGLFMSRAILLPLLKTILFILLLLYHASFKSFKVSDKICPWFLTIIFIEHFDFFNLYDLLHQTFFHSLYLYIKVFFVMIKWLAINHTNHTLSWFVVNLLLNETLNAGTLFWHFFLSLPAPSVPLTMHGTMSSFFFVQCLF